MWAAGQPRPTLAAGFAVGQAGRRTTTFNDVHWGISGPEIPFNTFMPTLLFVRGFPAPEIPSFSGVGGEGGVRLQLLCFFLLGDFGPRRSPISEEGGGIE